MRVRVPSGVPASVLPPPVLPPFSQTWVAVRPLVRSSKDLWRNGWMRRSRTSSTAWPWWARPSPAPSGSSWSTCSPRANAPWRPWPGRPGSG
ncbi:hypothetical protein [Ornithinimicrobium kibberense]|uniref:hypothetical protein n=1 Tax=Ornithinimicrobium kibberense TaxID=282060 RepID=UPI00361B9EFE